MVRAFILSAVLVCFSLTQAWATYTSTLVILDKKAIALLSDEKLTDTYMDTVVDVEARKDFFNHFGLVGKELDDYKAVLKYRLELLMEIHSRNLDIPQFERY